VLPQKLRQLGDIRRDPSRSSRVSKSVCNTRRQTLRGSREPSSNRKSTSDSEFGVFNCSTSMSQRDISLSVKLHYPAVQRDIQSFAIGG
jgi:hypothetical protein